MKNPGQRVGVALCTAVLMLIDTASAQQTVVAPTPQKIQSVVADPSTYGTASSIVHNLNPQDFVTRFLPLFQEEFAGVELIDDGGDSIHAPLHLPNGAAVESFEFFYLDSMPILNPTAGFFEHSTNGTITQMADFLAFPDVSNGSNSVLVVLLTPITINNLASHYSVRFDLRKNPTGFFRLQRVRVRYRLKVSPAPASATFADVPVGDPLHRFVEALVAAGITGGCGGGNYCPAAPVTRGQMAVFLAAALGLHWPN